MLQVTAAGAVRSRNQSTSTFLLQLTVRLPLRCLQGNIAVQTCMQMTYTYTHGISTSWVLATSLTMRSTQRSHTLQWCERGGLYSLHFLQ
jgi:hypothetical protein